MLANFGIQAARCRSSPKRSIIQVDML